MNSLRTDDILGAKPRVRHMPKDLIRERPIPQVYLPNIQHQNPEGNSQSPQYSGFPANQRFRLVQYQNNDPTGIPFMPKSILNKEPKHVNYDYLPSNEPRGRYQATRVASPQLMRAASEQRNLPEGKVNQNTGYERPSSNYLNNSVQSQTNFNSKDDKSSKRSKAGSRRSVESRSMPPISDGRQMFRGLGFNIITNNKYQYLFEHSKPSAF